MTAAGVIIVGAGHAGVQVAASLRQRGYEQSITLIGAEHGLPYQRPPLSKDLLTARASAEIAALRPGAFYSKHSIELRIGRRVLCIDRKARQVQLDDGERLMYMHLVLATGARPRPLPIPGGDLENVVALRTIDDALALRRRLVRGARVVIIGAGFIGLEVAAAARSLDADVTVLELAPRCMARALSEPTADHLVSCHRAAGCTIRTAVTAKHIVDDGRGRAAGVTLSDSTSLEADLVVAGVGVVPRTELAKQARLHVDDGVVVDARLATSDPAIWAIGDCCRFPLPDGRLVRLESVQNATDQARSVADAITGDAAPYVSVPWFWSDQHEQKLQIAGLLDGHDEVVLRGAPGEDGFSAFLYDGPKLVAVESINRPRDHLVARKLLAAGESPRRQDVADTEFDLKTNLLATTSR